MFNRMKSMILVVVLAVTISCFLFGVEANSIENDIQKYELDNGATLLLLPRDNAPIVSCVSFVNVGSVREKEGITGISHFLEHLAFKGTKTIGTTDYEQEKIALAKCVKIFDEIKEERAKGADQEAEKVEKLNEQLQEAIAEANKYVIDDEFSRLFEMNGGEGLNAATSYEMTFYTVSLPSNKLELWMLMEADRFTNPVFRQLYQERQVILEEKRMTESSPYRRFGDIFLSNAFEVHPYRNPIIGSEEDISSITNQDVENYFKKHYGAENIVFVVVGDVDPNNALALAKKHLSNIPRGAINPKLDIIEPEQREEKRFVTEDTAQPYMMVGYKVPDGFHPDTKVFGVIADILGQGRSSRLYRVLVEEKKLAVSAFSYVGYPGSMSENLFVIGVIPSQEVSLSECLEEVDAQIELLKKELVTDEELEGVVKRNKKRSIDRVKSASGLAYQLAYYESLYGDYKLLFKELPELESITKDDIKRVMNKTFVKEHRTIGELKTKGGSL